LLTCTPVTISGDPRTRGGGGEERVKGKEDKTIGQTPLGKIRRGRGNLEVVDGRPWSKDGRQRKKKEKKRAAMRKQVLQRLKRIRGKPAGRLLVKGHSKDEGGTRRKKETKPEGGEKELGELSAMLKDSIAGSADYCSEGAKNWQRKSRSKKKL